MDVIETAPAATAAGTDDAGRSARPAQRIRSNAPADRFMRRLLGITEVQRSARVEREAHRGFQVSLVVSGIRCLITYLLIPILTPIISFAGVLSAPIGIALCAVAAVSGVMSLRRFWSSDHPARWMYTWFIAVVFVVLAIAVSVDIARIAGAL